MPRRKNRRGFTLIELIVVIGIMGILATIAVLRVSYLMNDAAESAHAHNVRIIEESVSVFLASHGVDELDESNYEEQLSGYTTPWPRVPNGLITETSEPGPGEPYQLLISGETIEIIPGL